MLKRYWWKRAGGHVVVAHVILVSAQVLLVLTLGLWTSDLGLTIVTIGRIAKRRGKRNYTLLSIFILNIFM